MGNDPVTFRLRPVAESDVDPLVALLAEPEVQPWWGVHDAVRVRREMVGQDEARVIEVEGAVGGLLLTFEEDDPDYRHASLDIGLATRLHGRGLGAAVLRRAIDELCDERGHHRVTIDPAADNARAIRCYTSVGFRPVGVLRRYERGPDGAWRDGLLLDLLADERPWRR